MHLCSASNFTSWIAILCWGSIRYAHISVRLQQCSGRGATKKRERERNFDANMIVKKHWIWTFHLETPSEPNEENPFHGEINSTICKLSHASSWKSVLLKCKRKSLRIISLCCFSFFLIRFVEMDRKQRTFGSDRIAWRK